MLPRRCCRRALAATTRPCTLHRAVSDDRREATFTPKDRRRLCRSDRCSTPQALASRWADPAPSTQPAAVITASLTTATGPSRDHPCSSRQLPNLCRPRCRTSGARQPDGSRAGYVMPAGAVGGIGQALAPLACSGAIAISDDTDGLAGRAPAKGDQHAMDRSNAASSLRRCGQRALRHCEPDSRHRLPAISSRQFKDTNG